MTLQINQTKKINPLNWRIDEEILPTSQWRSLVVAFWAFLMLLVMCVSGLVWWQWLMVIFITVLAGWYYRHNHISQCFPVAHITQPPLSELKYSRWFVYVLDAHNHSDNSDNTAKKQSELKLWQGYLTSTYVNRYLVTLHFDIVEPLPRNISLSIWRDQMTEEGWRKLQVLGRL